MIEVTDEVTITPVDVGRLRIKRPQLSSRLPLGLRHLRTVLGRWAEPLPIYVWIVDHPEGRFLVDAGPKDSRGRWYYPRHHPYYPLAYRTRSDGGSFAALERAGIEPATIDTVVSTHLHPDHVGGLESFDSPPAVVVNRLELDWATSWSGRVWGNGVSWPASTEFDPVDLSNTSIGPFPRSKLLARDPPIALVPTPGHTHHHCSVIIEDPSRPVVLGGDVYYRRGQRRGDGVATKPGAALRSIKRVNRYAKEHDATVLVSHQHPEYDAEETAVQKG